MPYKHGIKVTEKATSMPTPKTLNAGAHIVVGTAPVFMASDPAPANTPVLCPDFATAKAKLGYIQDYDKYTLCGAMDAYFKLFAVSPVVFINVLDPSVAALKTALTESVTLTAGVGTTVAKGIILDELVVKDDQSQTISKDDYLASFNDDGTLTITVTKTTPPPSISLTGNTLDATKITYSDIVGSYDPITGAETGLEAVRKVKPLLDMYPGMITAPKWSKDSHVGAALALKCVDVNGVYDCECIVSLAAAAGTKYTDVPAIKTTAGYVSPHMACAWPNIKAMGQIFDCSVYLAAAIALTDANTDGVPAVSVDNKVLMGATALVLDDGTEVLLDTTQANTLNEVGIVTAIKTGGVFKAWGSNSAAYPSITDPKDRWFNCRRFFSWWGNNFIDTYFEKVGNSLNRRLIESVVDSENVRGNSLVPEYAAGIRMEYRAEDNPDSEILEGHVKFRQFLAPYTPVEYIENILEFDVDMLVAALNGGEE